METDQTTQLLTIPDVAERLKVSRATVYNLIDSGQFPTVKIGKSRRVTESALEAFIESQSR